MRRAIAILLYLGLLLIPVSVSHAAIGMQEFTPTEEPDTSEAGNEDSLGEKKDAAAKDPSLTPEKRESEEMRPAATTLKIRLRGEAGDGEINLTWYLPEHSKELKPVRYTLSYHGDGDKTEKKQERIKGSPYKLRGLKNGVTHYVRVAGYGEDGKEVASSDELALVPLSVDDMASPIERSFARGLSAMSQKADGEEVKWNLKQFGYDFFSNTGSSSYDNLPVGPDYVVGPGDSLRVDVWGSMQSRYDLVVDRNGEITIPKVGAVKVWGLSYSQLHSVISKAFSRYFRGYELNVTLGRLRTIQVFVVGEVRAPGAYTVSSLATAINALSAAGGPTKNGSLRQVRLLRGGKTVQEIDLYSMFLAGDRSHDIRVENGDTVFVPVIGRIAAVAGEVKRPGIYELKGPSSLRSLLETSGGITAAGDKGRLQVERLEGNASRVILDYRLDQQHSEQELAAVPISDRDMVKVFPFYDAPRHVVTLKGNVARPGEYQFREGMRLKDLLPDYEALLPDSYLGAVEITRLQLPSRHMEKRSANLGKALAGDPKENLELREQDVVKVFSQWQMQERPVVSISGEVKKPGDYTFYPEMTVRDLIAAAGSLKRNALMSNAELTRLEVKEGVATPTRMNLDLQKALAGDPSANLTLQPDDMLIVRSITQWLESSDRYVYLKGEVRYPGKYSIAKGERLSSVITRAGGFTDHAYLRGARFTRKSVQELQQKRMKEILEKSEQDILKKQGELSAVSKSSEDLAATKSSLDGLLKSVQNLKGKKAEGRVVMKLLPPEELAKTEYDLELVGGDTLEVPPVPSVVNVLGQVYNPTTFVYIEGDTVSSYLRKSGGPLGDSDADAMYIVRADGTVSSREQSSFGFNWEESDRRWHFGSFTSKPLEPGDTLVVPQKLEHTAWLREIKDITTIISQVALTAGTIFLYFK